MTLRSPMIGMETCAGLGFLASFYSVVKGLKKTEMHRLSVVLYFCFPFFRLLAPINANNTSGVGRGHPLIATVDCVRRLSKIDPTIVPRISINVVNAIGRPFPGDHRPDYSMCEVSLVENVTIQVTIAGVGSKRQFAGKSLVPVMRSRSRWGSFGTNHRSRGAQFPVQLSRLWIIVEKLVQNLGIDQVGHALLMPCTGGFVNG